jgi:hypothetical protein
MFREAICLGNKGHGPVERRLLGRHFGELTARFGREAPEARLDTGHSGIRIPCQFAFFSRQTSWDSVSDSAGSVDGAKASMASPMEEGDDR